MPRPRRARSAARPGIENLEGRKLLSVGVDTPDEVTAASEVAYLAETATAETPSSSSPDDVMFYATGGERTQRELASARRRAERMAERWEQQDAAGPRILDTTLLTRGDQIVGFAIRFDSAMRPEAASEPNAYRAIRITKPNPWLARLTYSSDAPQVEQLRVKSAEYHEADRVAVIWLQDPRRATGKFRVGVVTHQTAPQRRARPLALGPLTDLSGRIVRHNPSDVRLPGRNVLFTQPDHSAPFDSQRFGVE